MIASEPTPKVVPGKVPDELYHMFVDRVRDYAMFFLDRGGHVASWNDGAELIKGYAPEEVIGKHFSMFYPPSDVERKKPLYELQVATMDGTFQDEGWRLRKDGTMFWASVVITAIKYVDGTLLGFAKITRDLTERKHNDEAVRESEERFRLLVASIKDYAIITLDPKGRILTWNEGAERMKGYTAEEAIGRTFTMLYPKDEVDRGHPQEELVRADRDGRYEEEGWRVRKDGSRFRARVTLTPIRAPDGKLRGYAKITRDLTPDRAK